MRAEVLLEALIGLEPHHVANTLGVQRVGVSPSQKPASSPNHTSSANSGRAWAMSSLTQSAMPSAGPALPTRSRWLASVIAAVLIVD